MLRWQRRCLRLRCCHSGNTTPNILQVTASRKHSIDSITSSLLQHQHHSCVQKWHKRVPPTGSGQSKRQIWSHRQRLASCHSSSTIAHILVVTFQPIPSSMTNSPQHRQLQRPPSCHFRQKSAQRRLHQFQNQRHQSGQLAFYLQVEVFTPAFRAMGDCCDIPYTVI